MKNQAESLVKFSVIYLVSVCHPEGSSEYRVYTTDEIYNTFLSHRSVPFSTQFMKIFISAEKLNIIFSVKGGISFDIPDIF
jgi:hypothetical protein